MNNKSDHYFISSETPSANMTAIKNSQPLAAGQWSIEKANQWY